MKRIRYTEEQIIKTLQEVEAGAVTREVCRKNGITAENAAAFPTVPSAPAATMKTSPFSPGS